MYSLVLMTAMTGTPDAAGNGFFRNLFSFGGCSGSCNGCSGGARYSCTGGGCCGGTADYHAGCCGGGGFLGLGLFERRSYSNGCCGGCCGGTVAYGCSGAAPVYVAPAVSYTPAFNGGYSCFGGPAMAAPPPAFDTAPTYPGVAVPPPTIPFAPPEPAPPTISPERSGMRPAGYAANPAVTVGNPGGQGGRATVVVKLPADARLYADNAQLRMTGAERRFVSPELPAGLEFTYVFRVEYERNGETIGVARKVAVRAGGTSAVEFADLVAGTPAGGTPAPSVPASPGGSVAAVPVSNPHPGTVPGLPAIPPLPGTTQPPAAPTTPANPGGDRATITVRLPAGATLYVDDRKAPTVGDTREFTTPPLPAGREFAYLMKCEVVRDGRAETLTQKVPFRAGEKVSVDFTGLGR